MVVFHLPFDGFDCLFHYSYELVYLDCFWCSADVYVDDVVHFGVEIVGCCLNFLVLAPFHLLCVLLCGVLIYLRADSCQLIDGFFKIIFKIIRHTHHPFSTAN